nr:FxsA family protein [Listeria floridensis]
MPGVLTTLFGLLLFIPFVRKYVKPRLSKWFLSQSKRPSDYYFDM